MYYVYILRLTDNSIYVGYSSDVRKRLRNHYVGGVSSTKNLRPVTLIFYSAFLTQKKAIDFEKYLKSSSGFAFRNKRLI